MRPVMITIKQRLVEKNHAKFKTVEAVIVSMATVDTQMTARRNAVRADKHLSAQGQVQAVRKDAESHAAAIGRARRQVEQGHTSIEKRRAELRPSFNRDKTDLLSALIQITLAQKLAAMPPVQRIALLSDKNTDLQLISAAVELPGSLTGLSPRERAEVEATFIKLHHGPAIAQLDVEADALDLANQAVIAATETVREAGAFESDSEWQKFATAHDPVDAKAEAEESERLAAETVMAAAVALPLGVRITLGGALLDKNTADVVESERAA